MPSQRDGSCPAGGPRPSPARPTASGAGALTWQLPPPKPTNRGKFKDRRNGAELQLQLWLLPSFALAGAEPAPGKGLQLLCLSGSPRSSAAALPPRQLPHTSGVCPIPAHTCDQRSAKGAAGAKAGQGKAGAGSPGPRPPSLPPASASLALKRSRAAPCGAFTLSQLLCLRQEEFMG